MTEARTLNVQPLSSWAWECLHDLLEVPEPDGDHHLHRILFDAFLRTRWEDVEPLVKAGAAAWGISAGRFGIASARRVDLDRFELSADGVPVFLLALECQGALLDLLGWRWETGTCARFTGRGWALGEGNLGPNRLRREVDVVTDPLDYLREPFDRVMILDEARAWEEMHHLPVLVARDLPHAKRLQQIMRPPPWKGRVVLPAEAVAA